LPTEFVAAGGYIIGGNGPHDVVEAENFVFDQLKGLLECRLGRRFADKGVLRENEYGILGDTSCDLLPRVRVELFNVGR